MNKKIGFLGMGKMGNAILQGVLRQKLTRPKNISASDKNFEFLQKFANENSIIPVKSNKELVKNADIIIMCVKPFVAKEVLEEIKENITPEKLFISIVAGVKTEIIEGILNKNVPVIRVMPNTPALVAEGMSVLCKGKFADNKNLEIAKEIFDGVGLTEIAQEKFLDLVTGISGSGPAFYYKIINDIALAGQKLGLDYDFALKLSAQTAIGSAKMIFNTNDDVETLIKNVTTPGGCTAVGNDVLNSSNINQILFETVEKTAIKANDLGKVK